MQQNDRIQGEQGENKKKGKKADITHELMHIFKYSVQFLSLEQTGSIQIRHEH